MSAKSLSLKEEGNRHFQERNYTAADSLYSKAIIADPKNPALYTNRAMARLKLSLWDSVVSDCRACLAISPDNMKAHYYLSQAQLSLHDYDEALANAQHAYRLCASTGDKSLAAITAQVLRCKKERWEDREARRLREGARLELELVALLERERDVALKELDGEEEGNAKGSGEANRSNSHDADRLEIEAEWNSKIQHLQNTFERARSDADKKRRVPDWAIDDITFGIMVDPVMTKTGKSYERASIMEHLRRQHTDPLTREPLTPADLRPNLDLKQACEDFLEENGWAVDW